MRTRSLLVGLLTGLWACASPAVPPAPPPAGPAPLALVGVTVVPLDRPRMLPRHTVLVQGDRIVGLGPDGQVPVPARARVIDGAGRFLLPGLTDMHTHVLREADLWIYLARGVTTVRNMWGGPLHLDWRRRLATGEMLGPNLVTAGPIVDGARPVHDGSLIVTTAAEAEAAVALHRQAGYDLIKVYSGLPAPAYETLLQAARRAGLPVAAHIPRSVGLTRALAAGLGSIEHLTGFAEALTVGGRLDEAGLAALVGQVRASGVVNCPTRTVMQAWAPAAEVTRRLQRPEMRYVPAATRATWTPGPDRPDELARDRRRVELLDRLIGELHRAGAPLVLGTDPVNPLVVPGFSVHDELENLVRAGLSPYHALRAATVEPARLLGRASTQGMVAVGQRADLLLIEGDPLKDVGQTRRIAGVMVGGRWLAAPELEGLLTRAAAAIESAPAFAGLPELTPDPGSTPLLSARFRITWRDVDFGSEELLLTRAADGRQVLQARSFNPHQGQRVSVRLDAGAGAGQRLLLRSQGGAGDGQLEVVREGSRARLSGRLLGGNPHASELPLPPGTLLWPEGLVAARVLLGPHLRPLAVGQSVEVQGAGVRLGSTARLESSTLRITREADEPGPAAGSPPAARRYALVPAKGPRVTLRTDEAGGPLEVKFKIFGALLRFQRVAAGGPSRVAPAAQRSSGP